MAKIWFVTEKHLPTHGYKQADRDVLWCVDYLHLRKRHRIAPYRESWVIGGPRLTFSDDSRYVMVEIGDEAPGWSAGYYRVAMRPEQARLALKLELPIRANKSITAGDGQHASGDPGEASAPHRQSAACDIQDRLRQSHDVLEHSRELVRLSWINFAKAEASLADYRHHKTRGGNSRDRS